MRFLLPFAAALIAIPAAAQSDARQHPQGVTTSGNVGQVQVEDDNDPFVPNAFTGSFRMEMHRYKNGVETGDAPMNMHYWSSPDMTLMSMAVENTKAGRGTEMKVLTDLKDKWNYMLMTDPKGTKTAMKSHKKKYTFGTHGKDAPDNQFTVTKETKMIDGHKCTKVIGTTADGTWTGWVAKDIAVPFGDVANNMDLSAAQRGRQDWQGLSGFPLEYETADKDGKKTTQVFVKDLKIGDVDPSVFSISDYKVMEIPGIQRMPEK